MKQKIIKIAALIMIFAALGCQGGGDSSSSPGGGPTNPPATTVELSADDIQRVLELSSSSRLELARALAAKASEKNCTLDALIAALDQKIKISCRATCELTEK